MPSVPSCAVAGTSAANSSTTAVREATSHRVFIAPPFCATRAYHKPHSAAKNGVYCMAERVSVPHRIRPYANARRRARPTTLRRSWIRTTRRAIFRHSSIATASACPC
jgi:hypothetical protein